MEDKDKMNSEDLENCDEYPLPEWFENDEYELRPIEKVVEESPINQLLNKKRKK